MTEMEKLAQWHEEQAGQKDCTGWLYDHHTDAATTIRAAMAEIERLREVLSRFVDQTRVGYGNVAVASSARVNCPARIYYDARAALAAATPLIEARVREECAQITEDYGGTDLDGVGKRIAAAIRKGQS